MGLRETKHGGDKILRTTKHPRCPQDNVLCGCCRDARFSVAFAFAIHTERCNSIIFKIGAILFTIEDKIRGNMQKRNIRIGASKSQVFRSLGINRESCVYVLFRFVHGSISSGVDHRIRGEIANLLPDSGLICNIECLSIKSNDVNLMRRGKILQRLPHLPACARDQYLHQPLVPRPRRS